MHEELVVARRPISSARTSDLTIIGCLGEDKIRCALAVLIAIIATPVSVVAATTALANDRTPVVGAPEEPPRAGNPLWAIPLTSLPATLDRPIFSPSRRSAPASVVAAPVVPPPPAPAPNPKKPDHPELTLVGTIISGTVDMGIFLDPATKEVVRLKQGYVRDGWMLHSISARGVRFEKNGKIATLALPSPETDPVAPMAAGTPAASRIMGASQPLVGQSSAKWGDADGPPPKRLSP